MNIRRIQSTDGALLRTLALQMYADAPEAFSETLAVAEARTAAEWDGIAAWLAESGAAVGVVMLDGAQPCAGVVGMIGRYYDGILHGDERTTVTLARLWVAPLWRKRGVARKLLDAVAAWAVDQGAHQLELQVTTTNSVALRLYEQIGFVDTGRREPVRPDSALEFCFMRRPLAQI